MPLPEYVDSTMMGHFVQCRKKFFYSFIENLIPSPPSIDLHAGGCFAKGLEVARRAFFQEGKSVEDALELGVLAIIKEWGRYEAPEDSPKQLHRVCQALDYYLSVWPFETDYLKPLMIAGKACVEFSFALPIPEVLHPETRNPFIYCGRADMLGLFNNEQLFVVDEKTTTQLGPTWPNKWILRGQFSGYVWAAKQYDHPVVGAVVRGISFLKNGFGNSEAITYRPAWQIQRWYDQLVKNLQDMVVCYKAAYWGYNLDETCSMYGGCPFLRLCDSPTPEEWIAPYYLKRIWNPLKREEKIIEVHDDADSERKVAGV